jgi:hypothetical protein
MRKSTQSVMIVAVFCLTFTLGSLLVEAQVCPDDPSYGAAVENSFQGTMFGGGGVREARSDQANALGAPNREMFSLGFPSSDVGYIEIDLGGLVGPKLTVFENSPPLVSSEYIDQATWDEFGTDDGYPEEKAAVYVRASTDEEWEYVGDATNKTLELGADPPEANIHPNVFDVGFCFRYVKIVDASDSANFKNPGHDNFDVDAVYGWTDTVTVEIDVKPQSYPNCFNINGHGVIPVAILGSETFDVSLVDISSLLFNGSAVQVRGKKDRTMCNYEDVSGDFTYPDGAPDGYLDLVCQFEDDPSYWTTGMTDAVLIGSLLDSTPIQGGDEVCITQPVD